MPVGRREGETGQDPRGRARIALLIRLLSDNEANPFNSPARDSGGTAASLAPLLALKP